MGPPGDSAGLAVGAGRTQELEDKPEAQKEKSRDFNEIGNKKNGNERKDP
jgi:hypothetical protein